MVLVAVAEPPSSQATILGDIRRLSDQGSTVLCYASGASLWPLGALCRLLLAGATHVFDSDDHAFASTLRGQLHELLDAATAHDRDQRALHEEMLAHGIVGRSAAIVSTFRRLVATSAVSSLPVLITGETGTGKELAARAVHRLDGGRRDRPFVPVNCSAISAGMADSDLFGHRRGAFTGADRDRPGLFRAAHGGVLFLDEIGDLDIGLQGRLLRVLQERRVLTVGTDQEVAIDVRIVAATNRDLEEMVRQQTFRADLFHRLNVLTVHLPALRARPDDIAPLVEHFLARGTGKLSATPEFIDALRHLELPGNVRQLENIVHRSTVTLRSGAALSLRDLPPELWVSLSNSDVTAPAPEPAPDRDQPPSPLPNDRAIPLDAIAVLDAASWNLDGALKICEEQLVAAALGASRGNRARAARLLGISPRCIFNKLRKHRLSA